jgi:hypothetical protein
MDQRQYLEYLQTVFDHCVFPNAESRCWLEFKLICAREDLIRFQNKLTEFERGVHIERQVS